MSCVPSSASAEITTTVVIGSGLPGLAVASELSRRGVDSIVVSGYGLLSAQADRRHPAGDPSSLTERSELLRLLRTYASNHELDIRQSTRAEELRLIGGQAGFVGPYASSLHGKKWAVQTANGILLADNIVLTSCEQNQLRRVLKSVGIAAGRDLLAALRAVGLYLVGVGDLLLPTTREIVRQAKLVSEAIVSEGLIATPASA